MPLDFSSEISVLIFGKHLGSVSSVTSLWNVIDWHLADFFIVSQFCYGLFSFNNRKKNQSMYLCTIPKGNNKRIKFNQFSRVSHNHKYGIEHTLKQSIRF